MLDRSAALNLLQSFAPEPHMVQHALSSEAVMRALAVYFDEDIDLWALTGLLHDLDYPLTMENPTEHGIRAAAILGDSVPEACSQAIEAHAGEYSGVTPQTKIDYALRAAETVTGLISAAALVRPEGMQGMKVSSLKKKMKDKSFAASVSRERIRECEKIGLSLDEFLELSIVAMTLTE